MPTRLVHPNPNIQQAMRALARTNTPLVTIRAQTPFLGYLPDMDPALLGASACSVMENLVPGLAIGLGEVLRVPPGFEMIDEARLELGNHANTTNDILMLGWFQRTDGSGGHSGEWNDTTLAISAGDGATAGSCQLWRLQPSTGQWEEIVHSGHAGPPASIALKGGYPATGADTHLFDWAVMPGGASPRTGLGAGTTPPATTIDEPCFVFTNLLDPVMVYPVDPLVGHPGTTEDGEYEILTGAFGAGAAAFRARSVEAWGSRLNFLNTIETGVHYRQRLRRTALGNADPDPANDGSGTTDFLEFSGDGLRVESLGNLLACYFSDGVAVVRRSGNPIAPYDYQILTTRRGLLATHALANLGDGTHFGIFTDGFFFLDSSGQFHEAGVANVENIPHYKWKRTFFERIDIDLRERIFLYYDHTNRWIWMTLPMDGNTVNQEVWIYEIQGDRVFPAPIPVTVFGEATRQIKVGYVIDDAVLPDLTDLAPTIGGLPGTIGSLGAKFGSKVTLHGTHNGLVMGHDQDLTTQINVNSRLPGEAAYTYKSVLSSAGRPHTLKTANRLIMECIKCGGSNPTFAVFGNTGTNEQGVVSLAAGTAGDVLAVSRHFRTSDSHLGFSVTGRGPVQIRSFNLDAYDYGAEIKR